MPLSLARLGLLTLMWSFVLLTSYRLSHMGAPVTFYEVRLLLDHTRVKSKISGIKKPQTGSIIMLIRVSTFPYPLLLAHSPVIDSFVDRDMFMRYLGGGIGHKTAQDVVQIEDTMKIIGVNAAMGNPEEDTRLDGTCSPAIRTISVH